MWRKVRDADVPKEQRGVGGFHAVKAELDSLAVEMTVRITFVNHLF